MATGVQRTCDHPDHEGCTDEGCVNPIGGMVAARVVCGSSSLRLFVKSLSTAATVIETCRSRWLMTDDLPVALAVHDGDADPIILNPDDVVLDVCRAINVSLPTFEVLPRTPVTLPAPTRRRPGRGRGPKHCRVCVAANRPVTDSHNARTCPMRLAAALDKFKEAGLDPSTISLATVPTYSLQESHLALDLVTRQQSAAQRSGDLPQATRLKQVKLALKARLQQEEEVDAGSLEAKPGAGRDSVFPTQSSPENHARRGKSRVPPKKRRNSVAPKPKRQRVLRES